MLLQSQCSEAEVEWWCGLSGSLILRFVGPEASTQLLGMLSPATLSANPRLMLLRASTFREQERLGEAREAALVAANLAEAQNEVSLGASCMLLVARIALDAGDLGAARESLERLERLPGSLESGSERLLNAYMAVVELQSGNNREAASRSSRVMDSVRAIDDMGSDEAVFTVNCLASIQGLCLGMWSKAAQLMMGLISRDGLSALQRLTVRANLAAAQLELGCLKEARVLLDDVISHTTAAQLQQFAGHAYGTRSAVLYAMGDAEGGLEDYRECERLLNSHGHDYVRGGERLYAAVGRRAFGLREESLALSEESLLIFERMSSQYVLFKDLPKVELAASLLSLGDTWTAARLATEARESLKPNGVQSHLLRADLVLAEAERREGDTSSSPGRLEAHTDYIMTGSANWLTAMYVRAFPGLLGPLVKALGAESIPLRMLLMLPPETIDEGLGLAGALVDERDAQVLRRRRGSEAPARSEDEADLVQAATPSYSCYARLFGGLEVTTAVGIVDEEGWRKRKARLLFLILLLKQRQDVPRDVLLERLWPDMDEEHAKRNFYVTWSTMKRALACGGPPSAAKLLVQCTGGVCRITRHVRTDLDDFDEALASLRAAAASDDADVVLSAARRLVEIYRGELLPGDVYEEWFTEVRERTKHDFCDAMMAAASIAEAHSEAEAALLFLRKASAADAWREDVYQAMMRCQMNSGQRSRAIETYLSCRSRLTEDLGIDPSVETTRLYQAVLAMEEGSGLSTLA
ncbi:MAG: AfsR/SARP family transcriptional regulator [Anaerolineae bacterium]